MKQFVAAVLICLLTLHMIVVPTQAASSNQCIEPQFSIVLKTNAELKAKASHASTTVKTYPKNKKLSVMKRSGDWYSICYSKKVVYLAIEDAREVFNAKERAVLVQADAKPDVKQVVSAVGPKLQSTKVTIQAFEQRKGEWRRALTEMKGIVGKKGFTTNKKEGDGKSPIGMYSFGTAFGSQAKPSGMKLTYKKTTKYDYWVDDVTSKDYNKWITYKGVPTKKWKSFERMNHSLYKYGVVINYNVNPIVKGKGSAIFLHIWRGENGVTAGCVATSEKNVLRLLNWLNPSKHPHIIMDTIETL
ncbi:L,D-transpeptidase [Peribacillus asahii]|uniref:L,D-transpeptidase family protein n=1 Tax=Peribacillus asahii TaxID=228899 RepID=UPI00382E6358